MGPLYVLVLQQHIYVCMLYYHNMTDVVKKRIPLKKAHFVGSSVVVTLDPQIVRKFQIDDNTFFIQESTADGILMRIRKLSFG